jgi:mannose-6-phosphate isomerase-like protein (cupin superfamily)
LEDRAERTIRHDPAPNGTIFRVVEFPPENSLAEKPDIAAIFESMGSENIPSADDSAQHASMHFTNSIDYLSILSGEVSMVLQDGEVLLKQGDCIVQRGTKHGFINRGDVPCVISVVLVDAKPISQV